MQKRRKSHLIPRNPIDLVWVCRHKPKSFNTRNQAKLIPLNTSNPAKGRVYLRLLGGRQNGYRRSCSSTICGCRKHVGSPIWFVDQLGSTICRGRPVVGLRTSLSTNCRRLSVGRQFFGSTKRRGVVHLHNQSTTETQNFVLKIMFRKLFRTLK